MINLRNQFSKWSDFGSPLYYNKYLHLETLIILHFFDQKLKDRCSSKVYWSYLWPESTRIPVQALFYRLLSLSLVM